MKYTGINMFVPTYKRIDKLERFITSCVHESNDPSKVFFTFLTDRKDIDTRKFIQQYVQKNFCVLTENVPGPDLPRYYNRCYADTCFQDPGLLVTMVGDDMEFLSSGYDTEILKAANDDNGVSIIYCDDCFIQHEKMTVNLFMTRKLVEATGMPFMWPRFKANMIDIIWDRVGRKLGILHYLEDIKLQHHHKPADFDDTYHRMSPYRKFAAGNEKIIDPYVNTIVNNILKSGVCKCKR